MAEVDLELTVRAFVGKVRESGVPVSAAIAYGPCVKYPEECATEIKLIVVSDAFGDDPFRDGRNLLAAAWQTDPRIVPVPVTAETWADADNEPRLHLAKTAGKPIPLD